MTFDITEPKELNDAKLSNACSLHTASASTSSSNSSLRRRRLMEIAEEEEDDHRETKRQSVVEEEVYPGEIGEDNPRPRSPVTGPPVTLDSNLASSPQESQFAGTAEPPSFIGVPQSESPAKSFDDGPRRMSSQSSRQDYYSQTSYLNSKPRVKLGPRPSVDPNGRPRSSAGNAVRPVASMPAGLTFSSKGAKKGRLHDDSSSVISEEPSDDTFLASTLSIPEDTTRPHTSGGRPSTSSGISVKSMSAITTPVKQTLTPEKLRLMKAMQLREKKKKASELESTAVPSVQVTTPPPHSDGEESNTSSGDTETQETMLHPTTDTECDTTADQLSKADSGIDVASTAPTDHASVHTQTDSRPVSPIGASSELGDSTQASSVSDSTDETVHPQEEKYTEETVTQQPDEQPTTDVPPPGAGDIEDGPSEEKQDASEASLIQSDQKSDTKSAEAEGAEIGDGQDTESAEKSPPLESEPVEVVSPLESSLIPTSKFAPKVAPGEAAMDPMESRDVDPPNVTFGPGRIDEVDPAPVGPPERTEDGSAASPSKWNVPISKYSTHDSSKCLAPSPIPAIVTTSNNSPDGQKILADAVVTMDDASASGEQRRSDEKRRPEPIQTDLDLSNKEATLQDEKATGDMQPTTTEEDDSFTVTSPKSPVTTVPAVHPNEPPTPRILRTVSSPAGSPHSTIMDPPPSAARSVSGSTFQHRMSQPPTSTHLAPRSSVKVGSGISSRIKAFEQMAGKTTPVAPTVPTSKDRPSSAFFSVRQNSIRDGARSPSVLDRANSIYRGRTPTPAESLDGSPDSIIRPSRERSGSVVSRMSVFEGGNAPRGRPDTIQVTARIVREPGQSYSRPASQVDFSDFTALDFKQPSLVVDHQKALEEREQAPVPAADAPPVPTPLVHAGEPRKSLQERRLSIKTVSNEDSVHRPGQRTSLTMARDFIRESMVGKDTSTIPRPSSVHQSNSLISRLSISTRNKSISQDSTLLSPISIGDKSESGDEKKEGNRASRLMRRLSSTFSPKNKQSPTLTSPTLPEEANENGKAFTARSMTAPTVSASTTTAAWMGDVNVQFPENLLWKRRSMSIDSTGFLHLTPAQGAVSAREKQLKRFHMSEFKPPYAPEIEVQELPNSVCLDFVSGSGLQIAFQDRAGQLNGLKGKFVC